MDEFNIRLSTFVERANELTQRRLMTSNEKWSFKISSDNNSDSVDFHVGGPDEEDFRSFLLVFRLFILKKDPIFINRIFNDCIRSLPECELRKLFTHAQEEWKKALKGGYMAVIIGNKQITPEYALDLWINGYYFHNDPEKTQLFKSLYAQALPLLRLTFMMAIPDLAQIILYTAALIQSGLKENLFVIQ